MDCPYCGKAMEKGRLYGGGGMENPAWVPEGKTLNTLWDSFAGMSRLTDPVKRAGGFRIKSRGPTIRGSLLDAWICRGCGWGMFPLAGDEDGV